MTDYSWPTSCIPSAASWRFAANTGAFGPRQATRYGDRWACTLTLPPMRQADSRAVLAFIARLRGGVHKAVLPVYGWTKRGAQASNILVKGGSQLGSVLTCDGVTPSLTDALMAGDWLTVDSRLYQVAEDTDADGTGEVDIPLTTDLYSAPADNAAVTILAPTMRGILQSVLDWNQAPGGIVQLAPLEFVEDIP